MALAQIVQPGGKDDKLTPQNLLIAAAAAVFAAIGSANPQVREFAACLRSNLQSGNIELVLVRPCDVKLRDAVRFLRRHPPNSYTGVVLPCEGHVVPACDAPGSDEFLNPWMFPP